MRPEDTTTAPSSSPTPRLLRMTSCALLSAALVCLWPHGTLAQDAKDRPEQTEERAELSESIVVTSRADDLVGTALTATEGVTGPRDLRSRPLLRPGDLLETVPGLVATQHSGGGKANQYFLRGFNLDHGTDLRVTVEGMPVNLRSHGHGQGYIDVNWLIPELVDAIVFRKGPYYADEGDFSSAGVVGYRLRDEIPQGLLTASLGELGHGRALAAGSAGVGAGTLLGALEASHHDGPWEQPDDYERLNALVRYSRGTPRNGYRLTAQAHTGRWNATDQIPRRAVDDGRLSRFDGIDPHTGGDTRRFGAFAKHWRPLGRGFLEAEAYVAQTGLDLFSNFTYFLENPESGDQFEQVDDRVYAGGQARFALPETWAGRPISWRAGLELRSDWIDNGLHRTRARQRLATVRQDRITEWSVAGWAEAALDWTTALRTTTGVRLDRYHFDVTSDLAVNSGQATASLVSPKLSVAYRPWASTELYASFGGGFHSNDARGTTIRVDPASGLPTEAVDPLVRSWGFDAGLRTSGPRGLRSAFTVFGLWLDSELLYVGDAGVTEPSDASRRFGVEWANYLEPAQWLRLELDLTWAHARFDIAGADDHIPGALETVVSGGLVVDHASGWSGSTRLRHFGSYPLAEDGSVLAEPSSRLDSRFGYRFASGIGLHLEAFNLLNEEASDIQYFYRSRLRGERPEGLDDVHFHPAEPRSVRLVVGWQP